MFSLSLFGYSSFSFSSAIFYCLSFSLFSSFSYSSIFSLSNCFSFLAWSSLSSCSRFASNSFCFCSFSSFLASRSSFRIFSWSQSMKAHFIHLTASPRNLLLISTDYLLPILSLKPNTYDKVMTRKSKEIVFIKSK